MKIRIFMEMDDSVFRVSIFTEDWSEGDLERMIGLGEPEINVGGEILYHFDGSDNVKVFGDEFVRIVHGFPYSRGFDSRDYGSVGEAVSAGTAWKDVVVQRMSSALDTLRSNNVSMETEEVVNV